MDAAFLARYPFLPEAAALARDRGPSLEALLSDPAYARIRRAGLERARAAIETGELAATPTATEADALSTLLSYPVARILISALGRPHAIRRYAVAESKRFSSLAAREPRETVVLLATSLGLRPVVGRGSDLSLHFSDFVRYASRFRDPDWKLVNQPLAGGFVAVRERELVRLAEEAVRARIESELPLALGDEIRTRLGDELSLLDGIAKARAERFEFGAGGPVDVALLPPCMRQLLGQLQAGENVPHTGRFALTAFLHTVGMGSDEIMKLFSAAPDFKEDKTRYQVEHITGTTSSTEYTPPSCGTMVTWNVCPMEFLPTDERDRWCTHPKMKHPLTWYRWALFKKGQAQAHAQGSAGGQGEGKGEEPPAAQT
ncbi:MAG: DNA primase regulatory subunit PriL [Methanobacteriota archaeon]